MPLLPDPRPTAVPPHPWRERIDALAASVNAGDTDRATRAMARFLAHALAEGEGALVASAIRSAGPAVAEVLARAADLAILGTGDEGDPAELRTRVFLLPVLFVTAGLTPATVPGVIPDIGEVHGLLRTAGALGHSESFGLANALSSLDAAWALAPARLYAMARGELHAGAEALLPPAPIDIATAEEQAYVRVVAGVSLASADAPAVFETAGAVGRWGMAVSQALARQLGTEGLSLLPLPRAPMPWFAALLEAAFLREELAFNLFLTTALRRYRAETGDPDVLVSSHSDAAVRIRLMSPFDESRVAIHTWHLEPWDRIARVETSIRDLLRECRVASVQWHDTVCPEARPLN